MIKNTEKLVLFTGGGTAGHVTPNIAIMKILAEKGCKFIYIGRKNSIEEELISAENIPFYTIPAGKLRRYLSLKNISDILKISSGFFKSILLIKKLKPDLLFSKGGFVSCPVVWAARILKVPVFIHESDLTPGLANRLSKPFADRICYTFPETKIHFKNTKSLKTGLPVRNELFKGDAEKARHLCNFNNNKPIILVIGGSSGSKHINKIITESLPRLLNKYQLCHITGKDNLDSTTNGLIGYKQFEYCKEELKDIYSMAELIISRAGATTIFEILALNKLNLLIPLSKKASRGDQVLNAQSFKKSGFSYVIEEEKLNTDTLCTGIEHLFKNKNEYINKIESIQKISAAAKIADLILNEIK